MQKQNDTVFLEEQMGIALGDMLIKAGLITQVNFEDALKNRVLYGGKIGTSLIELGYLDEEALAQFLSKQLAVPYVRPEQLMSIAASVIGLIPKEMAQKYKVIPIALEKKGLTLVMADPADLQAVDEIAFATGYNIKPVVTPEVRLVMALWQYYQIEIDPRYQPVIKKISEIRQSPPAAVAPSTKPVIEPVKAPLPPVVKLPPEPEIIELEEELDVEGETTGPGTDEAEKRHTIDSLADEIAEAHDREVIADLLMQYVAQEFNRGALFLVRENTITGWRAVQKNKPVAGFENFHIPLDEQSVLKIVAEGSTFYLGPIPNTANNNTMLRMMGGGKPAIALMVPLMIIGRVVSILYVDGRGKDLREKVVDLQKLINKAAMAFEILILKNKIKMI